MALPFSSVLRPCRFDNPQFGRDLDANIGRKISSIKKGFNANFIRNSAITLLIVGLLVTTILYARDHEIQDPIHHICPINEKIMLGSLFLINISLTMLFITLLYKKGKQIEKTQDTANEGFWEVYAQENYSGEIDYYTGLNHIPHYQNESDARRKIHLENKQILFFQNDTDNKLYLACYSKKAHNIIIRKVEECDLNSFKREKYRVANLDSSIPPISTSLMKEVKGIWHEFKANWKLYTFITTLALFILAYAISVCDNADWFNLMNLNEQGRFSLNHQYVISALFLISAGLLIIPPICLYKKNQANKLAT